MKMRPVMQVDGEGALSSKALDGARNLFWRFHQYNEKH